MPCCGDRDVPITDLNFYACVVFNNLDLLAVRCRNLLLMVLFSRILPMVLQSVTWFSLAAIRICMGFARILEMESISISPTVKNRNVNS
jgi:hypothetical protein